MKQEELKMLENLLWEFRVQYSDELNKSELRSIIEVIALLIINSLKAVSSLPIVIICNLSLILAAASFLVISSFLSFVLFALNFCRSFTIL